MTDKKKTILEAVEKLTDTYRKEELFLGKDRERLPNKKEIINFIKDMRSIIFPGYFSVDSSASVFPEHYVAYRLTAYRSRLRLHFYIRVKKNRRPKNMQSGLQRDFLPMFLKSSVCC